MSDIHSQKLYVPALNHVYAAATPIFETLLRLAVGLWFVPHGAQKLFGLFGGGGIPGTAAFFTQIGLQPSLPLAILAGAGEFFGGLFLAFGLFTRPAAVVTSVVLLVAVTSVHIDNGFFAGSGGFEYPLLWLFATVYFIFRGGNRYSIDAALGRSF